MKKVIIDVMGGDNAPHDIIKGIDEALKVKKDLNLVLVGDKKYLTKYENMPNIEIVHTEKYLDMGEKDPLYQIRNNRDMSMFLAMDILKKNPTYGLVTAGPTQCIVLGGHLIVKRIEGVKRVAVAPLIPSFNKSRLLLDSGANLDLKAQHIFELSIMGQIVVENYLNIKNPKVGLLNIGSEEGKGREIDKETYDLLKNNKSSNFVGNVESRDMLTSDADVVVTDGFSGNLTMKSMEGVAMEMAKNLKKSIMSGFWSKLGGILIKKKLKNLFERLDPDNVGGAIILGLDCLVVKIHGSSGPKSAKIGILQVDKLISKNTIENIKSRLDEIKNA